MLLPTFLISCQHIAPCPVLVALQVQALFAQTLTDLFATSAVSSEVRPTTPAHSIFLTKEPCGIIATFPPRGGWRRFRLMFTSIQNSHKLLQCQIQRQWDRRRENPICVPRRVVECPLFCREEWWVHHAYNMWMFPLFGRWPVIRIQT